MPKDLEKVNALYEKASFYLKQIDNDWGALIQRVGPCYHQTQPERQPYEALIRAIAYQQLHARAAEAILNRFFLLFANNTFPTPEQILAIPTEHVKDCGFSSRKVETIQSIAQAALTGFVPDRLAAESMTEDELIKRLTVLPGIGQWTVEMFLINSLERMDILPVHDFGVREGYKKMKQLPQQLSPKEMSKVAADWSPYRTIASWYLWRF